MSMLTTLLLIDAIEKGGPGSGPHVLGAGAMDSLRRLAQDKTPEGRVAAARLAEYESRQSSAVPPTPTAGNPADAVRASDVAFKASEKANRTNTATDHNTAIKMHALAYTANNTAGRTGDATIHGQAIARHSIDFQSAWNREHRK